MAETLAFTRSTPVPAPRAAQASALCASLRSPLGAQRTIRRSARHHWKRPSYAYLAVRGPAAAGIVGSICTPADAAASAAAAKAARDGRTIFGPVARDMGMRGCA